VWSATGYEFQSVSSSILYPLLLSAIYSFFGIHLLIPFILNLVAAIVLLYSMQKWLQRQGVTPLNQLVILVVVNLLTPLPVMVALGMEHTLQILFSFLLIYGLCDWLAGVEEQGDKSRLIPWTVCLWGVLVTATRFEGVFLIMIAGIFLVWKKKWGAALLLGVPAALPILIFGLYSLHRGSYFLPNSVLLKSTGLPQSLSDLPQFLTEGIFDKLYYSRPIKEQVATESLLTILPLTYYYFFRKPEKTANYRYITLFLLVAVVVQLVFSRVGWFYRYEAYLMTTSILLVGFLVSREAKKSIPGTNTTLGWVMRGAIVFLALPIIIRSADGLTSTVPASHDIYNQNFQAGKFLHQYYDSTPIAINDLGAISYLTHGNNLDLWGLANIAVARSKREGYYTEQFLDSMVKVGKVKIAVVFDRLYTPGLLHKWEKIATWHIDEVTVSGDWNLNFYAVDTLLANSLHTNLRTYQTQLPPEVKVFYY
jgi:hypothetical protein